MKLAIVYQAPCLIDFQNTTGLAINAFQLQHFLSDMTMTNNVNTIEHMMQLIGALPAVQQLIAEKNQATIEEETKARAGCIDLLKSLRIQEEKALKIQETAIKKLRAAEENLTALKEAVGVAANAYTDASRARQSTEKTLITNHGESHVTKALHILHKMRSECERKAGGMDHLRFIDQISNGMIISRRLNPGFEFVEGELKATLATIQDAIEKTKRLIESNATPSDLEARTDEILASVGYVSNIRPDVTLDRAA